MIVLLTSCACGVRTQQKPISNPAASASSSAVTETTADIAYFTKQWKTCADQYMTLARSDATAKKSEFYYSAATCLAREGRIDDAFASLDASIESSWHDVAQWQTDADLESARADARWPALLAKVDERIEVWQRTLKAPELRRELLALAAEDQRARNVWLEATEPKTANALEHEVEVIDQTDTIALKKMIARYGWPNKTLIGDDGMHAAWLLAQHADHNRELQRDILTRMKPMVQSGDVEPADFAFLYDRVAVADTGKQLYGTQFKNSKEPFPIEDEAGVDARRKAMGMSTMAERIRLMAVKR